MTSDTATPSGLMMSLNTLIEFSDAFDFTPETSTDGVGR